VNDTACASLRRAVRLKHACGAASAPGKAGATARAARAAPYADEPSKKSPSVGAKIGSTLFCGAASARARRCAQPRAAPRQGRTCTMPSHSSDMNPEEATSSPSTMMARNTAVSASSAAVSFCAAGVGGASLMARSTTGADTVTFGCGRVLPRTGGRPLLAGASSLCSARTTTAERTRARDNAVRLAAKPRSRAPAQAPRRLHAAAARAERGSGQARAAGHADARRLRLAAAGDIGAASCGVGAWQAAAGREEQRASL